MIEVDGTGTCWQWLVSGVVGSREEDWSLGKKRCCYSLDCKFSRCER